MKHFPLILHLILLTLSACSNYERIDTEYAIMITGETYYIGKKMIPANDSIISYLRSINYSERLNIGQVRKGSLAEIKEIREALIQFCGGRDNYTAALNNPLERNRVSEFLISQNNGTKLKDIINRTTEFISEYDSSIVNLAQDPSEIAFFRNDPKFKNLNFSESHFKDITLVGALNVIAIYQVEVLQAESRFLNGLLIEQINSSL